MVLRMDYCKVYVFIFMFGFCIYGNYDGLWEC